MRHQMWMGPRGYEMWVPMPAVGPAYGHAGYASSSQLLNGGLTQRGSKSGHGVWQLTWPNSTSWDDIMPIRDMANGVYDTALGVNPIYWLEPTSMARNVLPPHWAAPHLAGEDAMPLFQGVVPSLRVENPSPLLLPARTAVYPNTQAAPAKLYIPIPPGHAFRFDWVADDIADFVNLAEIGPDGDPNGTVHTPWANAYASNGGYWGTTPYARTGSCIGMEISLASGSSRALRAMIATVLPQSQSPRANLPWRGGMGNSGCQFADKVGLSPQSVPLDQVGASTTLVETGAWL